MNSRKKYFAIPIAVAALLVGCGGDDDSTDTSSTPDTTQTQTEKPANNEAESQALALQADPGGALAYVEDSLDAKAGTVTIDFTNDSPIGHDVVIEQDGDEVARSSVFTGGSEVVTFRAKPGEYTFYCSVPGHREAGMEGSLTVE